MSSAVAPAIVSSEPMHRPMTARKRIGSNGSIIPLGRGGAAGGTSLTSWIGGTVVRGGISAGVRLAGDERLLLAEPLREHHAGDRRGGLGAEAAVLDGRRDDDRPALVRHEAHVPRLVVAPVALGRARLAVDRERSLVPALEDVGRGAVPLCRFMQALENGSPGARIHLDPPRGARIDLLDLATGRVVLDRDAEVRPHDAPAVLDRPIGNGHLERRGLEVALADREVHVVADRPRTHVGDPAPDDGGLRDVVALAAAPLAVADLGAPALVGDRAGRLAGQVDAGGLAEPEAVGHLL